MTADVHGLPQRLRSHVEHLAGTIGPRNLGRPDSYEAARLYVTRQLEAAGLNVQSAAFACGGHELVNVVGTLAGASERVVVIGAHYDSCGQTPGADDNASAVAALIEMARLLTSQPRRPRSTLQFVAFANEEPPYFRTRQMGSLIYARQLRRQTDAGKLEVRGMLCLEMLGYFRTERGSQPYPPELPAFVRRVLPSRGNFIALVGDPASAAWTYGLRRRMGTRQPGPLPRVPVYALAIPEAWTGGAHLLSDHWSFRQCGFPAVMATDTAFVRNPHYHEPSDLPDTLDYDRLARTTLRLAKAVGRS